MASDEAASDDAASDDAASDEMTSAASDDAASDDVTSGPLVFRSTILQEQLTSGALFLQEQLDFRSAFSSGASCLQERPSFKFLLFP
jgi:hypothetical protein